MTPIHPYVFKNCNITTLQLRSSYYRPNTNFTIVVVNKR